MRLFLLSFLFLSGCATPSVWMTTGMTNYPTSEATGNWVVEGEWMVEEEVNYRKTDLSVGLELAWPSAVVDVNFDPNNDTYGFTISVPLFQLEE